MINKFGKITESVQALNEFKKEQTANGLMSADDKKKLDGIYY